MSEQIVNLSMDNSSGKHCQMNLREKAVEYPSIECKRPVKKQQEEIFCDGCNQWQHRICNTGITRTEYRNAVKKGLDINSLFIFTFYNYYSNEIKCSKACISLCFGFFKF